MKLNQKGFTLVEGLLIIIALTMVVGVGFYVVNTNKDEKKNDETPVAKVEENKPPATSEEKIPEGYKEYKNQELKISFVYPNKWGDVQAGQFDPNGGYRYYQFSNNENFVLGGAEASYRTGGRGGSMTDYTGFEKTGALYSLRTFTGNTQEVSGYRSIESSNGKGIISIDVDFFADKYYHALFNAEGVLSGVNFAVPASSMSASEFETIMNSVKLL